MRLPVRGRNPAGGAAAVEFALVLPVLMTLVLGCVDFGRFASAEVAVTGAARAGAVRGSGSPWTAATAAVWQAGVEQAVGDELSGTAGLDPLLATVTVTPVTSGGALTATRVRVSYPFTTLVNWPGVPSSLTLTQTAGMACTRP